MPNYLNKAVTSWVGRRTPICHGRQVWAHAKPSATAMQQHKPEDVARSRPQPCPGAGLLAAHRQLQSAGSAPSPSLQALRQACDSAYVMAAQRVRRRLGPTDGCARLLQGQGVRPWWAWPHVATSRQGAAASAVSHAMTSERPWTQRAAYNPKQNISGI